MCSLGPPLLFVVDGVVVVIVLVLFDDGVLLVLLVLLLLLIEPMLPSRCPFRWGFAGGSVGGRRARTVHLQILTFVSVHIAKNKNILQISTPARAWRW